MDRASRGFLDVPVLQLGVQEFELFFNLRISLGVICVEMK